jgi:hypothetical protein
MTTGFDCDLKRFEHAYQIDDNRIPSDDVHAYSDGEDPQEEDDEHMGTG